MREWNPHLPGVGKDHFSQLVHTDESLLAPVRHHDAAAQVAKVPRHIEQLIAELVLVDGSQTAARDIHDVHTWGVLATEG